MKNVVLLGSTGTIGTSTVKVAEDLPDRIRLVGLAAGNNSGIAARTNAQTQARRHFHLRSGQSKGTCETRSARPREVFSGDEGLLKLATLPAADIVLIAIVGTAGLQPALAAIRAGKDIAVASKEILVMAGEIVMSEARKYGVRVLAVDSEHSAIFQCLDGKPPQFRPQAVADRQRRAVPRQDSLAQGKIFRHHRRMRAQTSVVGHGPENHD